jgi:protein SCO1/2
MYLFFHFQLNGAFWSVPSESNNLSVSNANLLKSVGIEEHLGEKIPLDALSFVNELGKPVLLSEYFTSKKPILLTLVYYKCPHLCHYMLNGFLKSLKSLDYLVGQEFEIISVSINPQEGPELAREKQQNYLKDYGKTQSGWHFLTGTEPMIQKLANSVGFRYEYDPKEGQYAHAAAIFVLTPQGVISRYLYGIDFKPAQLKLSLVEASDGKVGTVIDRLLLFCFHYDPITKKYSIMIFKLVQLFCLLTCFILTLYVTRSWRKNKKKELIFS